MTLDYGEYNHINTELTFQQALFVTVRNVTDKEKTHAFKKSGIIYTA